MDYFIKELNLGIEYYGNYWHANPLLFNENDEIKFPNNKIYLAKEIWKLNNTRINNIKLNKIDIIIWESDDINKILDNIIRIIKNKYEVYISNRRN